MEDRVKQEYYTANEVAILTGLKYSTVLKYGNANIFPVIKIGNGRKSKYLFPVKELKGRLDSFRKNIL